MVREETAALVQAITYTLWSPAELELVYHQTDDPIERARRYYVRLWMARYPHDSRLSFRRQKVFSRGRSGKKSMRPAAVSFMDIDHLYVVADRLRGVTIENMGALDIIERYDNKRALFYVDPPYVHDTRVRKNTYQAEMSDEQHAELANVLRNVEGFVVLSGYASELYKWLFENYGWTRVDKTARVDGADSNIESVWLSPRTADFLKLEPQNIWANKIFFQTDLTDAAAWAIKGVDPAAEDK